MIFSSVPGLAWTGAAAGAAGAVAGAPWAAAAAGLVGAGAAVGLAAPPQAARIGTATTASPARRKLRRPVFRVMFSYPSGCEALLDGAPGDPLHEVIEKEA